MECDENNRTNRKKRSSSFFLAFLFVRRLMTHRFYTYTVQEVLLGTGSGGCGSNTFQDARVALLHDGGERVELRGRGGFFMLLTMHSCRPAVIFPRQARVRHDISDDAPLARLETKLPIVR